MKKGRLYGRAVALHAAHEREQCAKARENRETAGIRLEQAERRFKSGLPEKGLACLQSALALAEQAESPAPLYGQAIKLYTDNGFYDLARKTLDKAKEQFPKAGKTLATQEAKLCILEGNAQAAVTILTPYYQADRSNVFIATTLANAHLHSGTEQDAIKILKPFYQKDPKDSAVQKVLANAYISTRQEKAFFDVIEHVSDRRTKDYLTAKFFYLGNESKRAMDVLRPYASGKEKPSSNIRYLFLACAGPSFVADGEREEYERWQKNPLRAEMHNDYMASSQRMFEEGANPVDSQTKRASSIERGALVPVRGNPPSLR